MSGCGCEVENKDKELRWVFILKEAKEERTCHEDV